MDNIAFSIDNDDDDIKQQSINQLSSRNRSSSINLNNNNNNNNNRIFKMNNYRQYSSFDNYNTNLNNLNNNSNNKNNDEAFEESLSHHSTITTISECQPINIHRHIFYSEDFYNKKNVDDNNNNNNNNRKNNSFFLDKHSSSSSSCCSLINCFYSIGSFLSNLTKISPDNNNKNDDNRMIIIKFIKKITPILYWLPNYNFRQNFLMDFIAGCTILALHIPQGLAYGRLAGVDSIYGLYVSLFPVIIYALFGTSRQVSIGTFAVISIACNDALENFKFPQVDPNNSTTIEDIDIPRPIDVLTTLALFVGIIQFILGFLQLGILSIILSETLIHGFVTACSYHVFSAQIFALIDIDSKAIVNNEIFKLIPFDIIKTFIRFFVYVPNANLTTTLISFISISILILIKFFIQPFLIKKYKLKNLVIPIDILLIIVITLISSLMDLNKNYNVKIIPTIPKAFEGLPKIPNLSYMNQLYGSAILISFVSFISTYSLGKIFAKEHNYEISANQELIAIGCSNIFSSFFLCYPCSGSLARSAVMNRVGAKTQLASIISSILLVIFLLFFSTYLRTLPMTILSCIIIVALWGNMKQITRLNQIWKISKLDGILWFITFLFTLLFGIGQGLLYSVLFSFFILILKLIIPIIKLKQQIKGTEVFIEINHLNENQNNKWIVFEYQGPLLFINTIIFRRKFHQLIGRYLINNHDNNKNGKNKIFLNQQSIKFIDTIIFDCTRLTFIDQKGVDTLIEIIKTLNDYNIDLIIASCSKYIYDNFEKYQFFEFYNKRKCYMSVMDAITDLEHKNIFF